MHYQHQTHQCAHCQAALAPEQLHKTIARDGYGLCTACRTTLDPALKNSSRATLRFYFALCTRHLSVKFIDNEQMSIDLHPGQLILSVDLPTGNSFPVQELAMLHDRLRYFDGETLNVLIPYSLSAYSLHEAVNAIAEFAGQTGVVAAQTGRIQFR